MSGLDITFPAFISVAALVLLIVISCINEKINVGFLGIGLAVLIGGFAADIPGTQVAKLLPVNTFMLLTGVTFMFGMAQTNGTLQKLTNHSLRLCGGNTALVPVIIFVLANLLSTLGPGNLAACALMAPLTMSIANRIKMPMFLMSLILVGSANAAALLPLSPTGIIGSSFIAEGAQEMGIAEDYLPVLAWRIHFNCEIAQGFVTLIGFLMMGGLKWLRSQRGQRIDIDDIAPRPQPFTAKEKLTLLMMFLMVLLVVLPSIPGVKSSLPRCLANITTDVGTVAFVLSAIMLLTGCGDSQQTVKVMPWGVIIMICGVTILIEVMESTGGLNFLSKAITGISGPLTVNFWVALAAAVISAYASSCGVVMPMFLSMAPELAKFTSGDPISICSSINVAAHLVDISPLSGLGAVCLAAAAEYENAAKLFRQLLIWGFSMSLVSAVICFVFFGLLGL